MQLKLIGLVVAAVLCIAGIWALSRPLPEHTVTASRAESIDCSRGVACPIIWNSPKGRK
jgi:hypothetical protein